ncbi:MAG: enoyl-CoA hydratase/isomerase family protein [Clostridiales Family XIII bacterium]|jgi:enoyl-CoA hydratase/carnithine racemase|nr:enoyl-CoA hydratase/isomerase family protein [Clostridiales Family XIII bacterium]
MRLAEYALREGHLAIITMKRSDKKNALNEDLFADLNAAWTEFKNDEEAWIGIITGEGDVFSAGADMSMIKKSMEGGDFWNWYFDNMWTDPFLNGSVGKPTIAAINGSAFGGGFDLALQADFRISVEDAVFRMPEADFGGVVVMWENVPHAISMEINCGCPLTAKRLYELGIFNRIVPKGEALNEAIKLAEYLLTKPPLAIRKNTQIVKYLYDAQAPMSRYALTDYCTQSGNKLKNTEDFQIAVQAFLRKSPAQFKAK